MMILLIVSITLAQLSLDISLARFCRIGNNPLLCGKEQRRHA
ncbi:MAG: hypothetical protein ACI8X3_001659 [Saprospiraceae bacterium]|jgi:hypothetical protein